MVDMADNDIVKKNIKHEKIVVKNETYDIPKESVPFINSENSSYIEFKGAKMIKAYDKWEYVYDCKINCPTLFKYIKDHQKYIFVKDGHNSDSILYYAYSDGYYKLLSEREFRGIINSYIPEEIQNVKTTNEVLGLMLDDENAPYKNNSVLGSDLKKMNYINFKNGVLDLRTKVLHGFDDIDLDNIIFTTQIPVDYKPLAECEVGKTFEHYMNDLVYSDTNGDVDYTMKNCLLEAMGLALSNVPGYLTKKCILMVGKKDCGKTQLKKLLTQILGIDYTSSIELRTMNENRFGTSELYGKRLVGSNDMQYTTTNDMGIFKQLTGGDPVNIEFKGKGSFSYIFEGLIWFLANDYPMFSGKKGKEIYERFMIIPCDHVVPKKEQDPLLVAKMLHEKEYIVSLCVEHLLDLINRKFTYSESHRMKEGLCSYEILNNSLLQFVNECCIVDDNIKDNVGEQVKFADFKQYYRHWCENTNIKNMKLGRDDVSNYLYDKFGTEIVKRSTYYLSNIKMNQDMSEDYGLRFGNG